MTFGSLFAGIGGLDLGLERAGMECRWQVEIDPFCRQILENHWPGVKRYDDIRNVRGDELESVDLICGGFPCQDLSQAGKRIGIEGTRSGLWFEFARIVGILRPRYVLIENVPGLLVPGAMRRVVGELARLGYVGCYRSLRASEFGASHLRKRVFIVAHRDGQRTRRDSREVVREARESEEHAAGQWSSCRQNCGERSAPSLGHCGPDLADREFMRGERRRDAGILGAAPSREPGEGLQRQRPRNSADDSGDDVASLLGDVVAATNHWRTELTEGNQDSDRRTKSERTGAELANSDQAGLIQQCGTVTVGPEFRSAECGSDAPLRFAPGPTDPRWPAILRDRPDLAPALEPAVRGVVARFPGWLDRAMRDRTKRLGRLGNAVVPQIAEWIGHKILEHENGTH